MSRTTYTVRERATAVMQARLSWPQADALAADLEQAGLLRAEAGLSQALRNEFTETELTALRLLIEGSSFQLRDTNFAMRLHAAVREAIDGDD